MADIIKPDLCVIGAGALGAALATRARQRGLSVVLVRCPRDQSNDPSSGLLRRAAFVASARHAQALRNGNQFGLSNAEPKPNFRTIGERAATIGEAVQVRDSDERLIALGITVLGEDARFVDRQTLQSGDTRIRARQFALATGSVATVPPLPGLDQVSYFTPDTIHENVRKLSHLVVIGGGPVAFELAQAYRRLGSMVTLVPQGGVLPGFDPELVAILLRELRGEGLVIRDDAEVAAINPRNQGTGIALRLANGADDALDVSHIMVATGNAPDLDAPLLDQAKLRRDRLRPDQLVIGADGQTSNPRISAIGGVAGTDAPHIAARQADLLIERLLGLGHGKLDPLGMPMLVMTQPALAQTGTLMPRTGQTVLRANLGENDAARATGLPLGEIKLVVDSAGTIAGAGAVANDAGELLAVLALAASRGAKLGDFAHLALPQPSAASALVDLAQAFVAEQPASSWRTRLPILGGSRR